MTGRFQSPLAADLERFLEFKRALGHPYHRAEFSLRSFDRFVREHAPCGRRLAFDDLVRRWLAQRSGRKPVSVAGELAPVRQFFLFRRRSEPGGFVPGRVFAPQSTKSVFVPHVFSIANVRTLLDAAGRLQSPPFYGHTIRTLLLVLYCTGLRFGEALRLTVGDVDLRRHLFVVRESKGKTRLVPFREDLARRLRAYRKMRDRVAAASSATFLVQPSGFPFSVDAASVIVRRLLRRTGLKPGRGRVGPRPYDFRVTFAVHRLTRWYRGGVDLAARLPWLSAYMGHVDLLGTERYLPATPELVALAGRRLRARLHSAESPR